jgi:NAD(P)-dependent dehydrogenase (short-subunit alcohol dehydrogenase family)
MTGPADRKVVLVTGASSGLGRATATLLAGQGHRVFGTSRLPSGADLPGVEMLVLDVREDASVDEAVESLMRQSTRIDVLINNAGYLLSGAIEETTIEEAKAQFDTNFFGAVRMVRAVLPSMRAHGGGRIINIGSLAGLIGVPFEGFYSASKHALEGYTASLRHEVRPFGIHVSMVEPGFFRSELSGAKRTPARTVPEYESVRGRAMASFETAIAHGPDPALVAATIAQAVAAHVPRLHYRIGRDAVSVPMLMALLPQSLFERGLRRRFGLDR